MNEPVGKLLLSLGYLFAPATSATLDDATVGAINGGTGNGWGDAWQLLTLFHQNYNEILLTPAAPSIQVKWR